MCSVLPQQFTAIGEVQLNEQQKQQSRKTRNQLILYYYFNYYCDINNRF